MRSLLTGWNPNSIRPSSNSRATIRPSTVASVIRFPSATGSDVPSSGVSSVVGALTIVQVEPDCVASNSLSRTLPLAQADAKHP